MLGEISLHLGDLLGLEAGAVPPLPSASALPPPLVPLLPSASALPPPGPVLPSASALPPLCPVLPPASALPSWSADLPALLPSCSARWPGNPVLQQGSGLCVPNCPARRQVLSPSSLDRRGCAVDLSKRNGLTPEEKNRCSKEPGFSSRDGLASTRSTGRAISLTTSTCAQLSAFRRAALSEDAAGRSNGPRPVTAGGAGQARQGAPPCRTACSVWRLP
jgi:hypothetical protein